MQLAQARSMRAYEPAGMFPDKSGLVVRQDMSDTQDLTNVELQQSLWAPGADGPGRVARIRAGQRRLRLVQGIRSVAHAVADAPPSGPGLRGRLLGADRPGGHGRCGSVCVGEPADVAVLQGAIPPGSRRPRDKEEVTPSCRSAWGGDEHSSASMLVAAAVAVYAMVVLVLLLFRVVPSLRSHGAAMRGVPEARPRS